MRICLVQPPPSDSANAPVYERLAALLSDRHEVVVVDGEACLGEETGGVSFASEEHRRSAAVLERIRAAYGSAGPHYLEVFDAGARGLVPLQARLVGDPLLRHTLVGVRIGPSFELRRFHDRELSRAESWRLAELEREQLRLADRLIWPGGDSLDLYRRYYAEVDLPQGARIGLPLAPGAEPPPPAERDPAAPLRILFAGDLQRHRGALDLVEACLSNACEDWELTLIGADTSTAAMGQSVRLTIEAMAGGDPRVRVEDDLPLTELRRLLPEYDLFAAPARVDAWSELSVEAMRAGLPVLATPVGGLAELVEDGASGWHTAGLGREAIGSALERLLRDRGELERVRSSGRPAARGSELAATAPILAAYEHLLESVAPVAPSVTAPPAGGEPLVTGVIPYFGVPEHIGEAVASLLGQTHRRLEVLIVNDGSFGPADSVLAELDADPRVRVVTQLNRGESAARNRGALLARGEYVVMLDADNALEPEFVERALRAFAAEPDLAYVTPWLRMVDVSGADRPDGRGYAPLGNAVLSEEAENWDGDTIALLPRRLFTQLGYFYDGDGSMQTDWQLYRWLRAEGRFGAVIPEQLARYRVRPGSLLTGTAARLQERGWAESRNQNLQPRMRWVAGS